MVCVPRDGWVVGFDSLYLWCVKLGPGVAGEWGGMVFAAGWGWAYQLHLLQALKRKPDLFLCERLDVKAVFQCGKWGSWTSGPGAPLGGSLGSI